MRSFERLKRTKEFFERELCAGREFKVPVPATGQNGQYGPDIKNFTYGEPRVFICWQPMKPNEPGRYDPSDPFSVCPAITIMPGRGYVRYVQEHRFDRYQNIHRSQEMGQSVCMTLLFSVYEPGIRMPGFVDGLEAGGADMALLTDGTEAGVETLLNWMDDAKELLLRWRTIPHTDLTLEDDNFMYSLFTDQEYIVDRRPLYYGFLTVEFKGHADNGSEHGRPTRVDAFLDG